MAKKKEEERRRKKKKEERKKKTEEEKKERKQGVMTLLFLRKFSSWIEILFSKTKVKMTFL